MPVHSFDRAVCLSELGKVRWVGSRGCVIGRRGGTLGHLRVRCCSVPAGWGGCRFGGCICRSASVSSSPDPAVKSSESGTVTILVPMELGLGGCRSGRIGEFVKTALGAFGGWD